MLNLCLLKEQLPDWVSIYFVKVSENEHRCNICEVSVIATEKSMALLEHVKDQHREVYDVHKQNPEATVGFRIEFLHLNVLKDDGDPKTQPVILGEVCEATTEEVIEPPEKTVDEELEHMVIVPKPKKPKQISERNDNRKRSWVWNYFTRISSIIFRCNVCSVVLSIKGCNTNNMNRHIRTRHPIIYKTETMRKRKESYVDTEQTEFTEAETPIAVKTEEITASDKDFEDNYESPSQRNRRSWVWLYFHRISSTCARCKLCNRNICHGGNATGNMNRHLKMIHQKTGDDHIWVWKVFETTDDYYSCKICQYRCVKFSDLDKSISCILAHLKNEHGVVSGDQIITGTEEIEEGAVE